MGKKLTIADILAQKEAMKTRQLKTETLYVPSLDAEITVQEPTRVQIMETRDMAEGEGDDYLVYQCVVDPDLKGNHAQWTTEFGCAEPHEIVKHLFGIQETTEIAKAILALAGISKDGAGVKVVEEVKN